MSNGIEISNPAPSPRTKDYSNNKNYSIVVLFDEDCANFLYVERLQVFNSIKQVNQWLRTNNFDYEMAIDNSFIIFRTSTLQQYFASIFWGFNHKDVDYSNVSEAEILALK